MAQMMKKFSKGGFKLPGGFGGRMPGRGRKGRRFF